MLCLLLTSLLHFSDFSENEARPGVFACGFPFLKTTSSAVLSCRMLKNLSAELPSFKGVIEATSSCFIYLGNILNSSICEGFEGGLLCGVRPRGEGASYTAVEMQLEKQSHPGNTLKEISRGKGFLHPKRDGKTVGASCSSSAFCFLASLLVCDSWLLRGKK